MMPLDIQDAIIPRVLAHVGFPVIEADQRGKIPDGTHAVFRFTMSQGDGVGRPNYTNQDGEGYIEIASDDVRVVISITSIAATNNDSMEAAQAIREWFEFYGYEELDDFGIVVAAMGDVGNRDSINEDERRNGFDVTLRVGREIVRTSEYFDTIGTPIGEFGI